MLRNRSRMIPGQCAEAATSSRISWLNRNGIHHRDGRSFYGPKQARGRIPLGRVVKRPANSTIGTLPAALALDVFPNHRVARIGAPSPQLTQLVFRLPIGARAIAMKRVGGRGEIEDEAALNDQLSRNSLDKIASSLRGVLPYLFCRLLLGAASLPCLGLEKAS
jgi:hypothetical protein